MTLPLAQSGLSFLIYLIVGIFWLVGNILQQKKAKQRAEEMRRKREEREREEARTGKKPSKPHPLEQDLETLLGRLSGEPVPPSEPAQPPPIKSKIRETEIQFDQALPPPPPSPIAQKVPQPKTDIGALNMADSFKEIEDIKDAAEISYEQIEGALSDSSLDTVKQVMVDLSSLMMNMPRVPVQRIRNVSSNTTPPSLKNKEGVKKAILSGAIIGPPLALQDPQTNGR